MARDLRSAAARVLPSTVARAAGAVTALLLVALAPATTAAHGLAPVYQSPLPLAVYLVGAAAVVSVSFVFVIARDMRASVEPARVVRVPLPVRIGLRVVGLVGWAWIMAQGIAGGSSDAAVAGLFLWVYGWVGVAMISALVFPVWEWLDPFATLFDLGAWALRRAHVRGWTVSRLPAGLRVWPAVAGFAFFVWVELVVVPGTSTLTLILAAYTLLTLVLMAQFGRDAWRAGGETFSVWFRTLNRLAAYGIAPASDEEESDAVADDVVLRRPFASGLLDCRWETARIVLVALAVASIIFDGLAQTVAFASGFGPPAFIARTVELGAFLGLVVLAAMFVARTVGPGAIGSGLLPIAVGYLVAHYLTYLLIDGQRIVIAVSDPLQTGADVFGSAFYVVQTGWLPPGLVWTVQLAAVVGGHMLGAWAGHVTAQRDVDVESIATANPPRDMRHRKIRAAASAPPNVRRREVPLAVVMVALSTLTLWSLGQAIVREQAALRDEAPAIAARP